MWNETAKIIAYPSGITDTTTGNFTVTYGSPRPLISGVSPSNGSTSGGTAVGITGSWLVPVVSVTIGGVTAKPTNLEVNDAGYGTLYVTSPPHAAGTVSITVTTTATSVTDPNSFTYVAPAPTPTPPTSPPAAPIPPGPGCSTTGVGSAGWSDGYWIAQSDGDVASCGNVPFFGSFESDQTVPPAPIAAIASVATNAGYYLVTTTGDVYAFGAAVYHGTVSHLQLDKPIVAMVTDPLTGGYWLVASDGGLFAFTAPFHGSMGGKPLNEPIVGMAFDAQTGGYYEVASDGGLFAFTAPFHGSMGGKPLNKPVVGMAVTARGGYYEVASDGGVFAFGAPFHGSTGCLTLNKPIIGIVVSPNIATAGTATACGFTAGQQPGGYQFVASDGGVFGFGNALFAGSLGGTGVSDVVGIAE
jgi:hypothetical protein